MRRHLHGLLAAATGGTDLPVADRWALADGAGRSGDLVFDSYNKRLKLYGLTAADSRDPLITRWQEGLRTCADLYTKLIIYARPGEPMEWITSGYLFEGVIAGFFAGGTDAHIWAAFGDEQRSDAPRDGEHDRIVELAAAKEIVVPEAPPCTTCLRAEPDHAPAIAELMDSTFADYPTPIESELIREQITGGSHVFRFLTDTGGDVVASASAEIDHRRRCAEMTDCATRPDQRGAGHMGYLLHRLAADVDHELGINDLYTLARADEVGMNCVFGKLGFVFTGRLVNNCRMPNGWESVNIWCKNTAAPGPGADQRA